MIPNFFHTGNIKQDQPFVFIDLDVDDTNPHKGSIHTICAVVFHRSEDPKENCTPRDFFQVNLRPLSGRENALGKFGGHESIEYQKSLFHDPKPVDPFMGLFALVEWLKGQGRDAPLPNLVINHGWEPNLIIRDVGDAAFLDYYAYLFTGKAFFGKDPILVSSLHWIYQGGTYRDVRRSHTWGEEMMEGLEDYFNPKTVMDSAALFGGSVMNLIHKIVPKKKNAEMMTRVKARWGKPVTEATTVESPVIFGIRYRAFDLQNKDWSIPPDPEGAPLETDPTLCKKEEP